MKPFPLLIALLAAFCMSALEADDVWAHDGDASGSTSEASDLGARLVAPGGLLRLAGGERWQAPEEPGIYSLPGGNGKAFVVIPRSEIRDGQLRGYRVGYYPPTRGSVRGFPAGFVEVTPASRKIAVSRHFKLGDFARPNESRSFILVSGLLVNKLEAAIAELRRRGYPARGLRILSAFRTPSYNAKIGNRTTSSRHTYGDAADVLADDWNGDGAITRADATILFDVVDKLDHTTPLKGGASIYPPARGHSWFVHTDARGQLIRW